MELMRLLGLSKGENAKAKKEQIASLLKTSPEMLKKFDESYRKMALSDEVTSDNLFDVNSRQASLVNRTADIPAGSAAVVPIMERIVDELMMVTNGDNTLTDGSAPLVSNADIQALPENLRPQLTGTLAKVDFAEPSYVMLLQNWYQFKTAKDPKVAALNYNLFRQGLDILDLDPITYEMLGMNPNSIGNWFPALKAAVAKQSFFKIPETKIVKVPLPILQLTRLDYFSLTPTTLKIVDDWAYKAFELDDSKVYFIKTGTYSSKFDFRNCCVRGAKEVQELGEYLLYIHFQANEMASPLNIDPATGKSRCIYGVSTTNEWCVREYIEDVEGNPTIYKGLPLHTEFRCFIDADAKQILGIHPYWDPDIMKKRFGEGNDSNSPHQIHDYIIYQAHEETLMHRYGQWKDVVVEKLEEMVQDLDLRGQWSVDVMLNGDDLWIIDMALAENSAFYQEVVPPALRHAATENWIPNISRHLLADSQEGST